MQFDDIESSIINLPLRGRLYNGGYAPYCRGFMSISSSSLEKLISYAGNPQVFALDIPH
jgi:hypothetical protein